MRRRSLGNIRFIGELFKLNVMYSSLVFSLADQRLTNWGHHLYHFKEDGDLSHHRHMHTKTLMSARAYGLTDLSKKMRKSNYLQMLEQRQHLLLTYL